jgi:UDP-N-acetylglucosamine 2-epimerase (non-hydrolysing)
MRIVSIVGTRPQFVKLAPIAWQAEGMCEHLIVNTGQHYDPLLSELFFSELNIPNPIENLFSGSGTHSEQTARMLIGLEKVLEMD